MDLIVTWNGMELGCLDSRPLCLAAGNKGIHPLSCGPPRDPWSEADTAVHHKMSRITSPLLEAVQFQHFN